MSSDREGAMRQRGSPAERRLNDAARVLEKATSMLRSTTLITILTVLSVFYPPAAFMIASIGSLVVALFLARDLFTGTAVVLESRPSRRERARG